MLAGPIALISSGDFGGRPHHPGNRISMGKKYKTFEVYLVYVDPDKCDGCEECARFCPVDVFTVSHKAQPIRPENCLGCGTCAAVCKSKAVIITEI